MHLSQSIHPYFAKNLGEKAILALFISLVSLFTIAVAKVSTPISMAQQVGPAISSVSGTISDGSAITITGSGFGAKSQAAPLRWDDFDSGTLGARLPSQANGGWTTGANQAGKEPRYSNTHVRLPGTLSAYQNFTGGNYNSEISLQGLFDGNVYLSGWFYRTSSGAPSRNFKWIQFRQGDLDEASWEFRQDAYPSTNSGHMYVANSCPNGVPCSLCDDEVGMPGYTSANCNMYYGMNGDLKTGGWHRYEIWLTQGTLGQNNGHARIWLDGQPWMNMNGVFDPSGCRFHNMWLGFYFATDTGTPQPQMETWWDELYVDTTPARVEICPNATWANKGKCEVQVASTWSNSQVTVRVNQGALNNGQSAYVYLVDANNVASQPYAITIAGTTIPPVTPPANDTQAPSAPTNLNATATSTQISLSWSASTDNVAVTTYNVFRSTTSGSGYIQIASTNTNSYINTGLTPGTTYYYRVRAIDAASNMSANSNQAQATVPVNVPPINTQGPSAPTNLTATTSGTQIALAWTASAGSGNIEVTTYNVFRSTISGSSYTQIASTNTNSYINTGLIPGTTYYYVVRAIDAASNMSGYSNQAQATIANNTNQDDNFSPWCSSLLGIVTAAVNSQTYNRVADINNDGAINNSDIVLATRYYGANNDSACQARFINTYNNTNYLNIDWCNGLMHGLQEGLNSTTGAAHYSNIFDINNDGAINLTDTVTISRLSINNDQAACFAEYSLPLPNDATAIQKITQLPTTSVLPTNSSLITKINNTKTEAAKLKLLTGRFAQLSDGTSAYVTYNGKAIAIDNNNMVQVLAKQALGISVATLAKLQVSLNYNGSDSDGDQVPDELEKLIGTDPNNKDSDGDGYADGLEIENFYSPTKNTPKAKLDKNLAKRLSGRILIVVPSGALFYVNPTTYKLELLKNVSIEQLNTLGLIKDVKGIKIRK
ncbi:MAG: fibronectin type III domain-containing protein [Patescibacteria group bacterium]|jgi:hypothetical protein